MTRRICGEFPTGTPSRKTAPQGLDRTAILPALSTAGVALVNMGGVALVNMGGVALVNTGGGVAVADGGAVDVGGFGVVGGGAMGDVWRALVLARGLGTARLGASDRADFGLVGWVVGAGERVVVMGGASVVLVLRLIHCAPTAPRTRAASVTSR